MSSLINDLRSLARSALPEMTALSDTTLSASKSPATFLQDVWLPERRAAWGMLTAAREYSSATTSCLTANAHALAINATTIPRGAVRTAKSYRLIRRVHVLAPIEQRAALTCATETLL
jgi:hypothetical protein